MRIEIDALKKSWERDFKIQQELATKCKLERDEKGFYSHRSRAATLRGVVKLIEEQEEGERYRKG